MWLSCLARTHELKGIAISLQLDGPNQYMAGRACLQLMVGSRGRAGIEGARARVAAGPPSFPTAKFSSLAHHPSPSTLYAIMGKPSPHTTSLRV